MKRNPYAKTDVDNAKALVDLSTAAPAPRHTVSVEAPIDNAQTKWSGRPTAKWKCPGCRTWTRDPISKSCLSCAQQQRSNEQD